MYRYIYKITCTAGSFKDKFYFGQHTTDDINDGYKGSGKKLLKYYKKYPNDYIKEIICFCSSQEELNQLEYDIIHPWINNKQCLNLKEGGIYRTSMSKESLEKMSKVHKNKIPWNKGIKGYKINHKNSHGGGRPRGHCGGHGGGDHGELWREKIAIGRKDAKLMTDGISKPILVKPEYWGEFIDIGYHFGKK